MLMLQNPRALLMAMMVIFLMMAQSSFAASGYMFPENQVPCFNIPKMQTPPKIDGTIDAAEWKDAVSIMGMSYAHTNNYGGRPHRFWVSWDDTHIYIAGRAHVLKDHILQKSRREKFTTGTVFDDAFEFGLSMEGRNQAPGEAPSFFKFILNAVKSGEYLKMYPSIGQYLYNWRPEIDMVTRISDGEYEGVPCKWFDIELSLDQADLEMPVQNKAGDLIKILLAQDGKNPGWQWLHVPSATGYLVHDGYPRGLFTSDQPYVQVEKLDGLYDEKIQLVSTIFNPGNKPVKIKSILSVANEKLRGNADITPKVGVAIDQELEIPANGFVIFKADQAFPGFIYGEVPDKKGNVMQGAFHWLVTLVGQPDAAPVYKYNLTFNKDTEKKILQYTNKPSIFNMETKYNPVSHKIWIEADTLDAQLPAGTTAAGAAWSVKQGDTVIAKGNINKFVYWKYQDMIQLPILKAGKYVVEVSLVDKAGKALVTRTADISKKDEAKEYPEWWGKNIGNPEKVLKPFEALKAVKGKDSKTAVTCVRRTFEFDSLGMPKQIIANDGPVLTAPARIVLVVDNHEYVVPTKPSLTIIDKKDWRYSFEGSPSEIAGVKFTTKGMMEQDGLVSLELTFSPNAKPVKIQEMRIEWPVDDSWNNHMAVMGVGGNYSARFIDAVPAGQGEVWSSLKNIGQAGSGMTLGNFYQNLWIGTEKRGFLWYGTSDEGWVPNDRIGAHTIVRDGSTTIVRNQIIGTVPGESPFELNSPRTIKFSYNASPFKVLTKGWRVNQRSACNGFSGGKYKVNWDTGEDFFSILSPPFVKRDRWAEYYAYCKTEAEKIAKSGIYDPTPRMSPYLTNQIALRGYMRKTVENDIYNYFSADWETADSGETLNDSYSDYMMWLQDRQVKEGGCRHFYYDISMCGRVSREIVAGMGYILPDGRIQPSGTDWTLRKWYMRANAMMQENGLYPAGISGHATQTIPLIALPFSDAILDSEFPMEDPIDVYPSARMIALSNPETFGCNINHLGFMNPDWAGMHDAGMGGGHGSVFDRNEWRHWGIERNDITFIPYWRNRQQVRKIGDGLICSIWKRPGSAILGVMNYGLDKKGFEKSRPLEMIVDLKSIGIPQNYSSGQVRVSMFDSKAEYIEFGRYVDHLKWFQDMPGVPYQWDKTKTQRCRPAVEAKLDLNTGAITGFNINYHDQYYIVIYWDEQPIIDKTWQTDLAKYRVSALNWGINTAKEITKDNSVKTTSAGITLRSWYKEGSLMLLISNTNATAKIADIDINIDSLKLKVNSDKLWNDFTSISALDGGLVRNVPSITDNNTSTLFYDGYKGKVVGQLNAGQSRLISIDKY
jgi:hypothetical protein